MATATPPVVFGYYHHNNAGDDAFTLFFDRVLGPGVLYCAGRSSAPDRVDRLVLGGGAVLSDYFFDRLPEYGILDIVGCSFPHGDGDVAHLKKVHAKLGIIALRSERDAAVARSEGIDAIAIPDLVFSVAKPKSGLTVEEIRALGVLPTLSGISQKTAVFLLSDHYNVRDAASIEKRETIERFKCELARAIDQLTASFNVILAPMSIWYSAFDNVFACDVIARSKRPEKTTVIDRYLGPEGIFGIVNAADIVVSMKYHGLVFGMVCGKPVINIGDTRKNMDLMAESDLSGYNLPPACFKSDDLLRLIAAPPDTMKIEAFARAAKEKLGPIESLLSRTYRG